ncbi:Leucine-rich repeat-containing N-terminal, plant-type [Sesbania bispinosa]|nr:Leucine-rich repeat-containing N-terminal, plant-type [Sesbania bispinosa]
MTKPMATILFILLTLLSHATSAPTRKCHPHDKSALLQIKKEFNNPTLLSSWKPDSDCCQDDWLGVICDFEQHYRVTDILITNNSELSAPIPPSLGKLSHLKTLYFEDLPNLTGPIPVKALSKLTRLKQITVKSTGLSGPIPYFPVQFKSLKWLELSSNKHTGPLPPSLTLLPNLIAIFFDNNKLTGSIPPSYSKFGGLVLSNNQLSGPLPKSFSSFDLFNLQLAHNNLEGDASMLFGSTKQTNVIDISWNKFSFDLGKVEVSKDLPTLDVSHNQIYGKLPAGIENVLNLNVSYNLLCGEIPKRGNLQKFDVSTYFHNKCLCGSPLPSCKK